MQNVSRRGFLRSLVSAPAAVVAAVAFPATVAARPRMWGTGERGPELLIPKGPNTVINVERGPNGGLKARIVHDERVTKG